MPSEQPIFPYTKITHPGYHSISTHMRIGAPKHIYLYKSQAPLVTLTPTFTLSEAPIVTPTSSLTLSQAPLVTPTPTFPLSQARNVQPSQSLNQDRS